MLEISNASVDSATPANSAGSPTGKLEPLARLAREKSVRSRVLYSAARHGFLPVAVVGTRFFARREDVEALFTVRRLGVEAR